MNAHAATRIYVSRRSWLDGGTEVLPRERKFTGYAFAPGASFARSNNNPRRSTGSRSAQLRSGRVCAAHSDFVVSESDWGPDKSGDDTWCVVDRHAFAASRRISPELCLHLPPSLSQEGAGKAGCRPRTRGPLREMHTQERTAQQHTGGADHSAFPARWSDGLCRALPGAELSFGLPRRSNWMMPSTR